MAGEVVKHGSIVNELVEGLNLFFVLQFENKKIDQIGEEISAARQCAIDGLAAAEQSDSELTQHENGGYFMLATVKNGEVLYAKLGFALTDYIYCK
jgi:hypothetical protein